jgi:lipoate-protein ligase A
MAEFRYLETGFNDAGFNMGLDEAVLESVSAGGPPTLRLYAWRPRAVSIGYFQGARDEVDLARCAELGVDVVRRLTGGGAVYHADELTYSVVLPESHELARGGLLESYRVLSAGVVAGLAELGVEASFAPLNDIVSGGRKLSGNAQTRRRGCVLQHGTVLLSVDPEAMFSVLLVPSEKLKGKLIEDVKARVASVSSILGRPVGYEEALGAFETGFRASLGSLG